MLLGSTGVKAACKTLVKTTRPLVLLEFLSSYVPKHSSLYLERKNRQWDDFTYKQILVLLA